MKAEHPLNSWICHEHLLGQHFELFKTKDLEIFFSVFLHGACLYSAYKLDHCLLMRANLNISVLPYQASRSCRICDDNLRLLRFLKSTMENIKLINRCAATISPIEKASEIITLKFFKGECDLLVSYIWPFKEKQQFLFWSEFFMEAIDSETDVTCARFPVLIQELTKVKYKLSTINTV